MAAPTLTTGQSRSLKNLGLTHAVVNENGKIIAAFTSYYGALLYSQEVESLAEVESKLQIRKAK